MLKNTTSPKKPASAVPDAAVNPFLDDAFYARMRAYTDRDPAIVKELKAIGECGAGARQPDAREAPSLQALRTVVKKGVALAQMFERIVAGTEKGLWLPWMTVFGFELRSVSYAPGMPRNACLALDLGVGSKAHALFAAAGVPNWRSHVSADCAELQLGRDGGKSFAIFYLDPAR